MAEVYRAKLLNNPNFERFFAIKRILPHLAADKEFVTMFINEAKVAVELEHPNVCQIYELGRLGQSHYIAMEFIAGRDILAIQSHYRRQKKIMSVSQACFIIAQAAQGLDYAHKALDSTGNPLGLVHRDVSPQNLLVTFDGIVKLIDFGVSKASRRASHSKSGVVKGKFSYMSPEQAADRDIDHRSDIFALGVVFWELLTGRRLFQSESEFAIMEMIQECKIEKPSKYNKIVPDAVDRICMKALEKDPNMRYAWSGDMVADLFEFIKGCKTPFTQWHLQNWMCSTFKKELDREWEMLPIFKSINTVEDIERYNREHLDEERREAGLPTESEAKTEDISALTPDALASDEKNGAALPPVPGRGVLKPGETSKSLPGVKSVSLSGLSPVSDDTAGAGARLSICASQAVSDDDIEFEPEGIAPSVSDPQILRFKKAERKALMRKILMAFIVVICLGFIASPILLSLKIIELPARPINLPEQASVKFLIYPESTETNVELSIYPEGANPKKSDPVFIATQAGQTTEFSNLKAGLYSIQVSTPGYQAERYLVSLENGSTECKITMTNAIPKEMTYRVKVSPEDAQVYYGEATKDSIQDIPNTRVTGTEGIYELKAIEGKEYTIRAFKAGYHPKTVPVTATADMSPLEITLDPGDEVTLEIASAPSNLTVFDVTHPDRSVKKGETPLTLPIDNTDSPITLEIKAPGGEPWTYTLDFNRINTNDIRLFADLEETP